MLAVMCTIVTASRRLRGLVGAGRAVLLACAAGAATALGVVFAVGVLLREPRYVIALVASGSVVAVVVTTVLGAPRPLPVEEPSR